MIMIIKHNNKEEIMWLRDAIQPGRALSGRDSIICLHMEKIFTDSNILEAALFFET